MKKTSMSLFAFAMLVALSAANAAPPPWEGCSFQNLKADFGTYEDIDPLPGYDYCFSLKLAGTLKGRFVGCGLDADFMSSEDIFGDDDPSVYGALQFDIFETEDGTIVGTERGFVDFDNGLQASIFTIEGGTGKYQGVTGTFTFSSDWPSKASMGLRGSGYVCPAK